MCLCIKWFLFHLINVTFDNKIENMNDWDSKSHTFNVLNLLCHTGADVPETEASDGKGEATSRARALQEVFDTATDTLAKRRPL